MGENKVSFFIKDDFDESTNLVKTSEGNSTVTLTRRQQRNQDNPTYSILFPVEIEYDKKMKDSKIMITVLPTGNKHSNTFSQFRGQFISAVFDEKEGDSSESMSLKHRVDNNLLENNDFVERNTWEEGKEPKLEIFTNKKYGKISLHCLAIFIGADDFELDPTIGIELKVEEINIRSNKGKLLGKCNFNFTDGEEEDFIFEEDSIIRTFGKTTHKAVGEQSSIHPKQLITVELLKLTLRENLIKEFHNGKIDIGYIGLDTAENLLSVIRYINRTNLQSYVNSLNIFYTEEWDDKYRRNFGEKIEQNDFKINWVEVDDETKKDVKVDFMISTYVAVWATNTEKIATGQAQEYFQNTYERCRDNALLISVDPNSPDKIARSAQNTGAVNVTNYYVNAGFMKVDSYIPGNNPTCEDSIWQKGELKYDTLFEVETELETVEPPSDKPEKPTIDLTKFISSKGSFANCAGIPTKTENLVKADVLYGEKTGFVDLENKSTSVYKKFGSVMPKLDRLRIDIRISERDFNKPQQRYWDCGEVPIHIEEDFTWWGEDDEDKPPIDDFIESIASMFGSGLMEVPLSIYSTEMVVIGGEPGSGKSIRLRQILHEIANHEEIIEVPILLKATALAEQMQLSPENGESGFVLQFRQIANAFVESNPDCRLYNLDADEIARQLISISTNNLDKYDNGIVLLIDGLDEIEDKFDIELLLNWIDDYRTFGGNEHQRCIITTRPSHIRYIEQRFNQFNYFDMYYEDATLQNYFPQALVKEWSMGELIVDKVGKLLKNPKIFRTIDRPLLIGFLCRFVRDNVDLGDLESGYDFYQKILDESVRYVRFNKETSYSEEQTNSIGLMRDCIAFIDLLGSQTGMAEKILQLSNKKNRIKLLKIRDCGLFPGLENFADEEMHKLFFEDLSLIYVAGNEDIGWTHDHLREYAAAKFHTNTDRRFNDILHEVFWNKTKAKTFEEIRDGIKTQGRIGRYSLFSKGKYSLLSGDFFEIEKVVAEEIMASRPYFSQACDSHYNELFDSFNQFLALANNHPILKLGVRIEQEIDIHPLEFSRLGSIDIENVRMNLDIGYLDAPNLNRVIKKAFVDIVKYFNSKDINWILDVKSESETSTYLELITGGIIGPLAEKILTVKERRELFLPVFKELNTVNNKLDSETIKACYFQKFINSSDNHNFEIYKKYLGHDYFSKGDYLDKNNLNVKSNFMEKMKKYYSTKNDKNISKVLFSQINKIAEPLANSEMKVLKYKLNNLELESKEKLANYEKMAHIYYMEGNKVESVSAHEKALEIANKLNLIKKQAEILMQIGDIAIDIGDLDYAEKALKLCLALSNRLENEDFIGIILVDLGRINFMRHHEQEAEKYYLEALEINLRTENLAGVYKSYFDLGGISYNQKRYEDAESYFTKARNIGSTISENHECEAILRLAQVYRILYQTESEHSILMLANKFDDIWPEFRAEINHRLAFVVSPLRKKLGSIREYYDEDFSETQRLLLNALDLYDSIRARNELLPVYWDLGMISEYSGIGYETRMEALDYYVKCYDTSLEIADGKFAVRSAVAISELMDFLDTRPNKDGNEYLIKALELGEIYDFKELEQETFNRLVVNLEKMAATELGYINSPAWAKSDDEYQRIREEIQSLKVKYPHLIDKFNSTYSENEQYGRELVLANSEEFMPQKSKLNVNRPSKVKLSDKLETNNVKHSLTFFKDLLMNNNPIYIDVLDLTFFGRMSKVEYLLNGYRTLPKKPSPISIVTTLHKDRKSRLIVDGRRFFITLYAAFIKSSELSKEHNKILDSFLEVYFLDNTDRGKFVDMINNPQDFGEDVELFVANIEEILTKFDDIDELIRCILRTPIRMTSVDDDDWTII